MIAKKEIAKLPVLPAKAHGRDEWIGRIRMHRDTLVLDVYDARRVMCPEEAEKDAEIMFRCAACRNSRCGRPMWIDSS